LSQVFEDEDDAAKYCDILQGGGQGCEGIAEIEASSVRNLVDMGLHSTNLWLAIDHSSSTYVPGYTRSCLQVFNICHKMKALAVLFRRGRTPPLPQSLERDLRARKRSLED
jgi:hypothetical protein